ncbi:hypothetical protein J3Q00_20425 [Pseudomonas sp. D2-3]
MDSFEPDSSGNLNRGVSAASLSYSSTLPVLSASFLGTHAGSSAVLSGKDSFTLTAPFLNFENLQKGIVLGLFGQANEAAKETRQCLLSIGNHLGVVLENGGYTIYTGGEAAQRSWSPDAMGFSEKGLFVVFSESGIELFSAFESLGVLNLPDLSGSEPPSIVLGDCADAVKHDLIGESVSGYKGSLDELIVVDNQSSRWLGYFEYSQRARATPFIARKKRIGGTPNVMHISQNAPASLSKQPTAFCDVEEELPPDEDEPAVQSIDSLMMRVVLMQASIGNYANGFARSNNGGYDFLERGTFAAFVYPDSQSTSASLAGVLLSGQNQAVQLDSYYPHYGAGAFQVEEDFWHPSLIQNTQSIRFTCQGEDSDCFTFNEQVREGVAFFKPLAKAAFALERDGLPESYDRALRSLEFTFNDPIASNSSGTSLSQNEVQFLKKDDRSDEWLNQVVASAEFSASDVTLRFPSRLADGNYRVVFKAALTSQKGASLGEDQVYEFSVARSDFIVTNDYSIGPDDRQHDGKRLIVEGATLTLSGLHDYQSVVVRKSGVITGATGHKLGITADAVEVDSSSRIDVSERGELGNSSIGNYSGGSYGGSGGVYSGASNAPYGNLREPRDFGTGGRQTSTNYTRGGGAIELRTGLLKLDGLIQANGQHQSHYGSGSGGSLLLHVETLQLGADARIEANGSGATYNYGGGGGGRVALYYGKLIQGVLHDQVLAKGGTSYYSQPGAAGSVYLKNTVDNTEELVFNNTNVSASAPPSLLDLSNGSAYSGKLTLINAVAHLKGEATFSEVVGNNGRLVGSYRNTNNELIVDGVTVELDRSGSWAKVRVLNKGVLTTPMASDTFKEGVRITADQIEVDSTSRIDVSERGELGDSSIGNYSGGSYGGNGGVYSGASNAPYGNFREPRDFGTGGRQTSTNYTRGGGAIELRAGLLKLDGLIQANGQHQNHYGSGSGGSLLLHVETLQLGADARIEANGSGATYNYGGGGGGRVALYYGKLVQGSLHDQVLAKGGASYYSQPGAAGSVYLKNTVESSEELVFNNTGIPAGAPPSLLDLSTGSISYSGKVTLINAVAHLKGDVTFSEVVGKNGRLVGSYRNSDNELIVDGVTVELDRSGSWTKVHVLNSGVLTTPIASDTFKQGITISADQIEVDSTSRIDVSGQGLFGNTSIGNYSGGSYGGSAGVYSAGSSNATYGDFREPKDFGTGGRQTSTNYTRGGGAIELRTGLLKLDGLIQANGQHQNHYGSGSGGSLLLHVETLQLGADARIEANGSGATYNYGGGGGGRVALYYGKLTQGVLHDQVLAKGGSSYYAQPGAAGSVYFKNTADSSEELVFNNTGIPTSAPMSLLDLRDSERYQGKITLISADTKVRGEANNNQFELVGSQLTRTHVPDGGELLVDGFTLELSQSSTWSKVHVINGGVITTHVASEMFTQGITLKADEVEIDATSRIDVSNKGLRSIAELPSYVGHSHGGAGGSSSYGVAAPIYGNYQEPREPGVGGYAGGDARGGGAIELVADLLTLDGVISANGQSVAHYSSGSYGSGSGGSILLSVDRIALGDQARIEANGGGRSGTDCCYAGGGGGGRVAVNYKQMSYSGSRPAINARGGVTNPWPTGREQHGAAGTVYLNDKYSAKTELVVDNTGLDKAVSATTILDLGELPSPVSKLTVINANVQLVASKLGETYFKDSVVSLEVDEINSLQSSNSNIKQTHDLKVDSLRLVGGGWNQAGFALNAASYQFTGATLVQIGDFNHFADDLIVDGFTLELYQSRTWNRVRVLNGGVLTVPVTSDGFKSLSITASEIEVDATSRIDVSAKGDFGTDVTSIYSGGSYGGSGGIYQIGKTNPPYGDFREPKAPGTGGRLTDARFSRGGGALELRAGVLKLDGRIQANGETNTGSFGSGSGGSLYLQVDALELGAGARIEANGGGTANCCTYGGGGGGRIAVHYRQTDRATLAAISQSRGGINWYSGAGEYGSAGTIYLRDVALDQAELIIDNSGVDKSRAATTLLDLGADGVLADKLTIVNANVQVVGAKLGEVSLKDSVATIKVDEVASLQSNASQLTQAKDIQIFSLELTGGSWDQAGFALNAPAYRFVGSTLFMNGAFIQAADDLTVDGFTLMLYKDRAWGKVRVVNGGVMTTPVASESLNSIKITADEIEVDAASRIDVSGKGNFGTDEISIYSGGSYGGSGGTYQSGKTNLSYGGFREPKVPGTGGRITDARFSRGGGALELKVGVLKLDGRIQANGETNTGSFGSGSGGSLYLQVDALELGAGARIEANGGGTANCCTYGGGGGGRIAVHYRQTDRATLAAISQSRGGINWYSGAGEYGSAGTIYLRDVALDQAELIIDNSGVDKSRAATTLLDLGADGVLADKLTIVNANVQVVGAKLGEVSLKDSVATIKVDEVASLQSNASQLTQAKDIQIFSLELTGGSWDQAGFALNAPAYRFVGSTLFMNGAFIQAADDLTVDGFTLMLYKDRAWGKVRVVNGGVMTTPVASESLNSIKITADEIEVDAASRIDVSGKGNFGTDEISIYSGGSYGGSGGTYQSGKTNLSYGGFREPKVPGTGGRITDARFSRGGGALELKVGVLKLDGRIQANGETNTGSFGSGSGGSLYLQVDALELGAGARIEANGGGTANCCTYGGGGGGRIAVHYRQTDRATLAAISQSRGGINWYSGAGEYGSAGTIYLRDVALDQAELIIDNSGVDKSRAATTLLDLGADGVLADKLTIVNANVQVVGAKLGEVSLKDSVATIKVDEVASLQSNASQLTQAKDIQVANLKLVGGSWDQAGFALNTSSYQLSGSTLMLSGVFNQAAKNLIVDGFTAELSQSLRLNRVYVLNGGVITTPFASDKFTQGITVTADEIEVDASSRIDVSGRGLLPSSEVGDYCGGSHGGLGGQYGSCGNNSVYGDYLAPTTFGMGGRYYGANYPIRGGGSIKLVTRSLKLDGQLLANGATSPINTTLGGGAGGSLWVDTQVLLGSATTRIQANGGNGLHSGGPGGGGRIAIYYAGLQGFDVISQISVAAGSKTGSATAGQQGSLHLENRVVSTAVAGTNLLAWSNQALRSFNVDFINAVDAASVTAETVRLMGPQGPVALGKISALNTVRYQVELADALADGNYELRVGPGVRSSQGRGMDQNGNGIEDEADDVFVHSFVVDRIPPVAPVVSSPNVAPAITALTVRQVTIAGEREAQTAILVNGVQQVAHGSGAWTINNYSLAEGSSELQVQSRDAAGNLSPAALLKFSVDSIHPSFQQYSHGGSIKEVPTSMWVRFRETGSGLDFANSSLVLKRDSDAISGQLSLEGDVLRLTPGSALLEGNYYVSAVLKDKAGNQSTATYSFTLDYTAPLAPAVNTYPALTTNKQVVISGSKESGSHLRVFSSANGVVNSSCCGNTTWQLTLSLEPGDNAFTVTQTDAAGNVSPATALKVRFDNEAPGPVTFTMDPKGSGTELKLVWPSYDEVANGNDIQHYRIYSSAQPFEQINQARLLMSVPSGNKQALLKDLKRGEEQYFAVVAVDLQGLMLNVVSSLSATPEDVQAPADAPVFSISSKATQLDISWQASPDLEGDLAGYVLYVGEGGSRRIELPLSSLTDGLRYSLTGLEPASSNPLRLVAVDATGNESSGRLNLGVTWLNNPRGVELKPLSNRFDASWAGVEPAGWVSGYRLYVADQPFTSVQGKAAKAVLKSGQLSASISGLLNNKTYHVAVTAVNASAGENPQVQSFSVTPTADSAGPELLVLSWHNAQGSQDMLNGGELLQLGEWRIQAKDESGIGRIDLSLDGKPIGQAIQADAFYRYAWDLSQMADGDYQLEISLRDTLDNVSQVQVPVTVALAPPLSPVLNLQSNAAKTNTPQQTVVIQGQPNTLARVSFNGDELSELAALNSSGQAQVPLTLIEGENQFTASLRYGSREQFGAPSSPLNVSLDSALPNAPGNLQAVAKAQGVVQLSWSAVGNVAGYNLYAANQPFEAATESGVTKVGNALINALSYQHQPATDGTYFYRVSSQNALGSESPLSAQQSVRVDRTPPRVEEAVYRSQGQVSVDGRYGPGRVDVRLRMSEPLRNAPFFSMDVAQGVSIPVRMSQAANDPLSYQGSFDLGNAVPSGLLYARVSAHDSAGNEGNEIADGKTLRVDTQGPDLQQLSLLPESPVENLVASNRGRELQVVLRLSEDSVTVPQLTPLLDGQAMAGQAGPLELVVEAQSQPGAPVYSGRFRLPASAGEDAVQLLGFAYQATDDMGNVSQRIQGRREFQVYQGNLPPLDIPQGLSGKSLAGGRVALQWKAVRDAGVYQLYRRAEADAEFISVGRARDLSFEDDLPAAGQADGVYYYRVVSVREHDGKEALSLPSEAVKVQVLSQAPGAPQDLSVELNGAGIVLRWLAPESGQAATYNLYRTNTGQGQPVDITELTPLQSKIPERIVLDSRPSDTDHSYTVTAVDAAGNESAAAKSVYLNAGLLPVRDLSIQLVEGQAPLLQWDHGGKDVAGYNLYAGAVESSKKLNSELITAKTYNDQSTALPFMAERLYSVTAVDAQGVESVPHTLLLPALKAELRAEQVFERGVFNQLHFRVTNSGSQELQRLRLRVTLSNGGQARQHLSDYFAVGAGAVSEVPIVVAGYQNLPGVVPLSVEVLYAPQVGEEVSIERSDSITAGENTLLVQVLADEFTRGGTGSVRLRLENSSPVATELVTALGNGSQPSSEMRLVLEDLQGNVLASEPIKASVGNGLVTVRDGRTVARVGARDVLETGPFSLSVPAAAPDKVRVRLEVDLLHYQTALPGELTIGGLRSSRELTLVETPYYGDITNISPQQVQSGDTVTLRGRALTRSDSQPLANVELKLVLGVRGFEQVVTVNTNAEGEFEYQHKTNDSDSGSYQVSLIHPNIQGRPQQGQFLVQGAAFSPAAVNTSFPRNYEQTVTIVVEAGHDTPLKNVRLEYVQPSGVSGLPTGLKVQQGAALNLASKQRGNLTLRISGDNSAAASGLLDYRIVADGLTRPIGQTRIQYSLVQAQAIARVTPAQIRTGMSRESEQVEQLTLSNTGLDVLRNVRLTLLDEQGGAAPGWVSLRTAERMGDLPAGANNLIGVAFKPAVTVPEGDHYFTLRIDSDNAPSVTVPMSVAVTQSGKGGVIFQVEDIYTGTLDAQGQRILGLKGAKIKLQNRNVLSEEFTASTEGRGQVLLEDIPAGEYAYRISAWDHDDISGQLWIKPGVVTDQRVFLMSKLVTVEWSVKEIPLQDRYEIILNATFKTNVPTALVMIEPLSINLPVMRKGDVFQGELTLTNYGLIRADEVSASLPSGDARTRIEYLRTVPDTLEAGDVVVIPYRIVALQSFDPDDELNGAAGCWSFNYQGVVNYKSICANGEIIPGRANVAWSSNGSTGNCGATGGGIGGGGAGGWGGWGGGWGGGFIPRPTPVSNAKQCPPPPDCDNGNCGGANGGSN